MHFALASRLSCVIVAPAGKTSQVLFSCMTKICLKTVNFTKLLRKDI